MRTFAELAFTPAVQALQERDGSRAAYARQRGGAGPGEGLGPNEAEHIAGADSFYLATVSETGWPYVQHRGGPRGFLKVVSPTRLAFPDFRGNRQFVSAGNAWRNNGVSLIVVDYLNQTRLKLLGRLRFSTPEEARPELASAAELNGYRARVERIGRIDVEAFDWNCPQHITPRLAVADAEAGATHLRERLTELDQSLCMTRDALGRER